MCTYKVQTMRKYVCTRCLRLTCVARAVIVVVHRSPQLIIIVVVFLVRYAHDLRKKKETGTRKEWGVQAGLVRQACSEDQSFVALCGSHVTRGLVWCACSAAALLRYFFCGRRKPGGGSVEPAKLLRVCGRMDPMSTGDSWTGSSCCLYIAKPIAFGIAFKYPLKEERARSRSERSIPCCREGRASKPRAKLYVRSNTNEQK